VASTFKINALASSQGVRNSLYGDAVVVVFEGAASSRKKRITRATGCDKTADGTPPVLFSAMSTLNANGSPTAYMTRTRRRSVDGSAEFSFVTEFTGTSDTLNMRLQ